MGKIRDITFDIAKGIGIVLVVIGHYIPDNAPSWYIGFVSFVYHFHMPLFFLIQRKSNSNKTVQYKNIREPYPKKLE